MKLRTFSFFALLMLAIACTNNPSVPQEPVKQAIPKFMTAGEAHLGVNMKDMHYFTMKLGVAVRKYNFILAQFYSQELQEVADELVSKNIIDNGVNISEQVKIQLSSQIKKMEESLGGNSIESIKENYKTLISSCNSCHTAVEHSFIIVEEPKGEIDGQHFDPVENKTP